MHEAAARLRAHETPQSEEELESLQAREGGQGGDVAAHVAAAAGQERVVPVAILLASGRCATVAAAREALAEQARENALAADAAAAEAMGKG